MSMTWTKFLAVVKADLNAEELYDRQRSHNAHLTRLDTRRQVREAVKEIEEQSRVAAAQRAPSQHQLFADAKGPA